MIRSMAVSTCPGRAPCRRARARTTTNPIVRNDRSVSSSFTRSNPPFGAHQRRLPTHIVSSMAANEFVVAEEFT